MPATALAAPTRTDWRARAACRGQNPAWWADDNPRQGKTACLTCPVLDRCLNTAMRAEHGTPADDRADIHGGLTPTERVDLADDHTLLGGDWDAEEARLIALEAAAAGRRVQEIARREGTNRVTERLASRLLGRPLTPAVVLAGRRLAAREEDRIRDLLARRTTPPTMALRLGTTEPVVRVALDILGLTPPEPSRLKELVARKDELLALRDRGTTIQECADTLGYSYHTVQNALRRIRATEAARAESAVAAGLELAS